MLAELFHFIEKGGYLDRTLLGTLLFMFMIGVLAFSRSVWKSPSALQEPPVAPYWIPYFGHVFEFFRDPGGLVQKLRYEKERWIRARRLMCSVKNIPVFHSAWL